MQVFGNIAKNPERKVSKTTQRGYYEMRLAESQRGIDSSPTFYTVRVMKDVDPQLEKGDFVRVTGKLKADFYMSREGKPTGNLLVIAFEAQKIAKPAALMADLQAQAQAQEKKRSTGEAVTSPEEPVSVVQRVPTNNDGWYD
ncbi:single-strand-binding protein/primosomal replication protein n [Rhodoferax saidenbachensis]|uniref:Single-stranded DNA-binding protein n=1 Tax=Rhodoferax saidenbachensis TaxID=1484693 RepID=A0ABU1ZQZ2_9BURK|nr:single-strand-binding protein/primosomal replication protein n [Rhodoferax saidenbachensis]MDR7307963.1 single-stranded DNA-binding protein [Rhodoferax saidenbachensis]